MESAAILLLHYFFAFHIMIIVIFIYEKFAGKAGINTGGIPRFNTWNAA